MSPKDLETLRPVLICLMLSRQQLSRNEKQLGEELDVAERAASLIVERLGGTSKGGPSTEQLHERIVELEQQSRALGIDLETERGAHQRTRVELDKALRERGRQIEDVEAATASGKGRGGR